MGPVVNIKQGRMTPRLLRTSLATRVLRQAWHLSFDQSLNQNTVYKAPYMPIYRTQILGSYPLQAEAENTHRK